MASKKIIKKDTLNTSGGVYNIDLSENFDYYVLTGTGSLSGSWTISSSTPSKGDCLEIMLDFSFVRGLNNITVLGVSLGDLSELKSKVEAIYDGSSWNVSITPYFNNSKTVVTTLVKDLSITGEKIAKLSIDNTMIKNGGVSLDNLESEAVDSTKIKAGSIVPSSQSGSLSTEIIIIPVSFDSGEQCRNRIVAPFNGRITQLSYIVTKGLSGTDNGLIEIIINGVPTTPGTITVPLSSAINATATTSITSSNTFTDGQVIDFTSSKVTPGGKLLLSIELQRT